jgi:hypothetical protein
MQSQLTSKVLTFFAFVVVFFLVAGIPAERRPQWAFDSEVAVVRLQAARQASFGAGDFESLWHDRIQPSCGDHESAKVGALC